MNHGGICPEYFFRSTCPTHFQPYTPSCHTNMGWHGSSTRAWQDDRICVASLTAARNDPWCARLPIFLPSNKIPSPPSPKHHRNKLQYVLVLRTATPKHYQRFDVSTCPHLQTTAVAISTHWHTYVEGGRGILKF